MIAGDALKTLEMLKEGISITYEKFDEKEFQGDILIFEESTMLHTLAKTYFRMGKMSQAILLIKRIKQGIESLPRDDFEKNKQLTPIMLTLSDFLVQIGDYKEAIEVCDQGNKLSIRNNHGRYTPDFVYNKAICLYNLHGNDGGLLQQVYFGYIALGNKKRAEKIKSEAQKMGIDLKTHGAENMQQDEPDYHFDFGNLPASRNVGELLKNLREQQGLSAMDLYQGVCSKANYFKIENGEIEPHVYYLEVFMQRLGRDINLYLNTFLSPKDFEEKQMRNEIILRLVEREYESAEELLLKLEKRKAYKSKVGLQFIKSAKVSILTHKEGHTPECLELIREALKLTRPEFDEDRVMRYCLSYNEIVLINEMALYFCRTNELDRGIRLFKMLRYSMDHSYLDETEKKRMYTTVLYNHSAALEEVGDYSQELQVAIKGQRLAVKYKQLTNLNGFAVNRASALFHMRRENKESVPFFAIAYYVSALLGHKQDQQAIANFVQESLRMTFD